MLTLVLNVLEPLTKEHIREGHHSEKKNNTHIRLIYLSAEEEMFNQLFSLITLGIC